MLPGGHFDAYIARASTIPMVPARDWFLEHLQLLNRPPENEEQPPWPTACRTRSSSSPAPRRVRARHRRWRAPSKAPRSSSATSTRTPTRAASRPTAAPPPCRRSRRTAARAPTSRPTSPRPTRSTTSSPRPRSPPTAASTSWSTTPASTARDKRVHEFSEEDLDVCFDVNCKGSFFGAQSAIRQFLAQGDGGNIINLVSTAGLQGHPSQSVYNISKGAQAQLTRCLAIEYGKDGIRTNGICPTFAKTSLTRALFDDKDFDEFFVETVPLKRWGEVDDIAGLAVFLASDESSYIHGDLIRIDGGETLCRYSV